MWSKFICVALASLIVPLVMPLLALLFEIHAPEFHSPLRRKSRGEDGTGFGAGAAVHDFCNFDRLFCCNATAAPVRDSIFAGSDIPMNGGVFMPTSIEQVQSIVAAASAAARGQAAQRPLIRVIGAGHSMSSIVCSAQTHNRDGRARAVILVSLDNVNDTLSITETFDPPKESATHGPHAPRVAAIARAPGGMRLKQLNERLWNAGYALFNTGMIAEQSVGGVTSTSVHGTGLLNEAINMRVVAMEVVLANGTLATFSRASHPAVFVHSRMHLGLFGVVVGVSFEVRKRFYVRRREQLYDGEAAMHNTVLLSSQQVAARKKSYFEQKNGKTGGAENDGLARPMRAQAWWFGDSKKTVVQDMTEEIDYDRVHGGDESGNDVRIDVRPSWMRSVEAVVTDIFMLIATSLSVHVPATTPYVQKLSLLAFGASRDFVARSYEAFTHPGTNYHSVRYSEVELFVPSDHAAAAFRDYQAFLAKHMEATPAQRAKLEATHDWCNMNAVAPLRTTAVDDIPLSPAGARSIKDATAAAGGSDQTVVAFSFTLIYRHNFARCARELQTLLGTKYGARPHFGKFYKPMLMTRADVERMYGAAAVESFAAAVKSVDPHGLFRPRELEVLFIGE